MGIFGYLWAYLVQGGWLTGYMRDKVAVWGEGEGECTSERCGRSLQVV